MAVAEVTVTVSSDGRRVMTNRPAPVRRAAPPGAMQDHRRALSDQLDLEAVIERWSGAADLDPDLVHAVIQAESAYDPLARSSKGAMGLMQLMPGTAVELAVTDPYDPEQNVRGGTTYLRRMLEQFDGRLDWALAAYNAGPEAVSRYRGVPPYPETENYVDRVLTLYHGGSWEGRAARGRPVVLTRSADGSLLMTTSGGR
jgi:soluble lytic murein transglycosylase